MFGRTKVDEVTVAEAAELQAAGAILVDVREANECDGAPGVVA